MKSTWILLTLALVVAMPAAVWAAPRARTSQQDRAWMQTAHQANLTEIKAGKLAENKANAAIVRKTSQTLVTDHKKLDSALKRAAQELGVSLPDSPSVEQKNMLNKARSKSGSEFDKFWTRALVEAHLKAINMTQLEIRNGDLEWIKKLAKKALPILRTHLNMLRHVQDKL